MAAFTSNKVCDNSSLANFKSWAQTISSAFSTLGWIQTADTGQVNWASIAAVPAGYVYEVWKAADTLASTMPIYVKVEYGSSTTQVNVRMTVGTGSSGAGVITGVVISSAPWQITNTIANQGVTTYPCYFSGHAGEFRMWMWGAPAAAPAIGVLFVVERSKDATGADTADYVTVLIANQANSSQSFQQTFTASALGNRDTGVVSLAITGGAATGSALGTVAALPIFPLLGKVGNPMLGFMSCWATDVAVNSSVTVTSMYGATHTFLGVGGNAAFSAALGQRSTNTTTIAGLMRYE